MKNNKKGFTIIELLAVIVILGVIVAIGFTAYNSVSTRIKKKQKENILSSLKTEAKSFYKDTGISKMYVETLLNYGYAEADAYVEKSDRLIKYDPTDKSKYLNCYMIDVNEEIDFDQENTGLSDCEEIGDASIDFYICHTEKNSEKCETLDTAKWYNYPGLITLKGTAVPTKTSESITNTYWIDFSNPTVTINGDVSFGEEKTYVNKKYSYNYQKDKDSFSRKVNVKIDKIAPSVSFEVVNNNVNFSLQDNESGLASYVLTQSTTTPSDGWTAISGKNKTLSEEIQGSGTYFIYVKDKAGNITKSEEVKINNVEIELEYLKATTKKPVYEPGSWTKNDIEIKIKSVKINEIFDDINNYVLLYTTDLNNVEKYEYSLGPSQKIHVEEENSYNKKLFLKVCDKNNNAICFDKDFSLTIRIDKVKPVIQNVRVNVSKMKVTYKLIDSDSGLKKYAFTINSDSSKTSTTWTEIGESGNRPERYSPNNSFSTYKDRYIFVEDLVGNTNFAKVDLEYTAKLKFSKVKDTGEIESYTPGNWTKYSVKVKIESINYKDDSLDISNFTLKYSNDGNNYTDCSSSGCTFTNDNKTKIYFKVCEKNTNICNDLNGYNIFIDKTAPSIDVLMFNNETDRNNCFDNKKNNYDATCQNVKDKNTYGATWRTNDAYNVVYYKDEGSGIKASTLAYKSNKSFVSIENAAAVAHKGKWSDDRNGTVYYKICDKVGNCSTTNFNLKIDKTPPSIGVLFFNSEEDMNKCYQAKKSNYNADCSSYNPVTVDANVWLNTAYAVVYYEDNFSGVNLNTVRWKDENDQTKTTKDCYNNSCQSINTTYNAVAFRDYFAAYRYGTLNYSLKDKAGNTATYDFFIDKSYVAAYCYTNNYKTENLSTKFRGSEYDDWPKIAYVNHNRNIYKSNYSCSYAYLKQDPVFIYVFDPWKIGGEPNHWCRNNIENSFDYAVNAYPRSDWTLHGWQYGTEKDHGVLYLPFSSGFPVDYYDLSIEILHTAVGADVKFTRFGFWGKFDSYALFFNDASVVAGCVDASNNPGSCITNINNISGITTSNRCGYTG